MLQKSIPLNAECTWATEAQYGPLLEHLLNEKGPDVQMPGKKFFSLLLPDSIFFFLTDPLTHETFFLISSTFCSFLSVIAETARVLNELGFPKDETKKFSYLSEALFCAMYNNDILPEEAFIFWSEDHETE